MSQTSRLTLHRAVDRNPAPVRREYGRSQVGGVRFADVTERLSRPVKPRQLPKCGATRPIGDASISRYRKPAKPNNGILADGVRQRFRLSGQFTTPQIELPGDQRTLAHKNDTIRLEIRTGRVGRSQAF